MSEWYTVPAQPQVHCIVLLQRHASERGSCLEKPHCENAEAVVRHVHQLAEERRYLQESSI